METQKKKGGKINKVTKKLRKLQKAGKLKRHTIDAFKDIKARSQDKSRKRVLNIEEDWVLDREAVRENEEDEDVLPLDMLDADLDWESSAFANVKKRHSAEDDNDEIETKRRRFVTDLDEDREEMLPIKLSDGRLVRPTREKATKTESEEQNHEAATEEPEEDISLLSASELLALRKTKLKEAQVSIANSALALLADSQENVYKLRDLFNMCCGTNVHSLVRESVQLKALASLLEVFIDIIPGYAIRPQTEEEKNQKQKKETKKLRSFEEALLRYYLKFLQFLEKNALKLGKKGAIEESTFAYRLSFASLRALAHLLVRVPHFNYTTNIVSVLTRLSLSQNNEVIGVCCSSIAKLFKDDFVFKLSLHGVKAIAVLVNKRKGNVPPALVASFLSLNIKEVKNEDKKSAKDALVAKKYMLKKERTSKSKQKYVKQLKKLEADMKEAEAAESLSTRMKHATETMKYVFTTYFRVLKRMPSTAVLRPVLEGLSKFAHLLNVEFFDDIVTTMETLMDNKQLSVLDRIYCVNTVFVMLSGEGKALNVDPRGFYRTIYALIPAIVFEKQKDVLSREIGVLTQTLNVMLNERRKQVPLERVAAFVKRLVAMSLLLPDHCAIAILSLLRFVFVSHPRLSCLVDTENEDEGSSGPFRADLDDPDIVSGLKTSIRSELLMLNKRKNTIVKILSENLLCGVPSSGTKRLTAQLATKKPWEFVGSDEASDAPRLELDELQALARKKSVQLTSKNVCSLLLQWIK